MKQIDTTPKQSEPVDDQNVASQPSLTESQSSEVTVIGEEPDTESEQEQKVMSLALPPSPRERREIQVAEQPARSVSKPKSPSKSDTQAAAALLHHCRQLCVSLFFREQSPIHSLGFTSAVGGEGKTFLAQLTASIAAHDSAGPTTLLECDWEHPSLHEQFGIPSTPGLAEWLRSECSTEDIRSQVGENLFVIPAGDAREDAIKLLRQLQRGRLRHLRTAGDELLIVDLPPILTTSYGALAASLVEAIMVVVRAGVTPNDLIKAACEHLKDLPVEGLILNQAKSRIPRWIRQLL